MVEDDKIDFNGIEMSDFVYLAYFDLFRLKEPKSAQYDYIKRVKRPFQILEGGIPISTKTAASSRNSARRKKTFRKRRSPLSSQSIPQETT